MTDENYIKLKLTSISLHSMASYSRNSISVYWRHDHPGMPDIKIILDDEETKSMLETIYQKAMDKLANGDAEL